MHSSGRDWEDFNEKLSWEIVRRLRAQLCPERYMARLRELKQPSEKLIYHYLIYNQPKTFIGIMRALKLSRYVVYMRLKILKAKGYVFQDNSFRYWLTDPELRT